MANRYGPRGGGTESIDGIRTSMKRIEQLLERGQQLLDVNDLNDSFDEAMNAASSQVLAQPRVTVVFRRRYSDFHTRSASTGGQRDSIPSHSVASFRRSIDLSEERMRALRESEFCRKESLNPTAGDNRYSRKGSMASGPAANQSEFSAGYVTHSRAGSTLREVPRSRRESNVGYRVGQHPDGVAPCANGTYSRRASVGHNNAVGRIRSNHSNLMDPFMRSGSALQRGEMKASAQMPSRRTKSGALSHSLNDSAYLSLSQSSALGVSASRRAPSAGSTLMQERSQRSMSRCSSTSKRREPSSVPAWKRLYEDASRLREKQAKAAEEYYHGRFTGPRTSATRRQRTDLHMGPASGGPNAVVRSREAGVVGNARQPGINKNDPLLHVKPTPALAQQSYLVERLGAAPPSNYSLENSLYITGKAKSSMNDAGGHQLGYSSNLSLAPAPSAGFDPKEGSQGMGTSFSCDVSRREVPYSSTNDPEPYSTPSHPKDAVSRDTSSSPDAKTNVESQSEAQVNQEAEASSILERATRLRNELKWYNATKSIPTAQESTSGDGSYSSSGVGSSAWKKSSNSGGGLQHAHVHPNVPEGGSLGNGGKKQSDERVIDDTGKVRNGAHTFASDPYSGSAPHSMITTPPRNSSEMDYSVHGTVSAGSEYPPGAGAMRNTGGSLGAQMGKEQSGSNEVTNCAMEAQLDTQIESPTKQLDSPEESKAPCCPISEIFEEAPAASAGNAGGTPGADGQNSASNFGCVTSEAGPNGEGAAEGLRSPDGRPVFKLDLSKVKPYSVKSH